MNIRRIQSEPRMSQAVVHGNTVYLAGQVGSPEADFDAQTRQVLDQIDALLAEAGSNKAKILTATVWLADMKNYAAMNRIWDAWIGGAAYAPARATGEVKLATPDYKIEIIIIAAL